MDLALRDHPAETALDAGAAVAFAAACAFAASSLFGLAAMPAGLLALVPAFLLLRQIEGNLITFELPAFEPPVLSEAETCPEELLLTADMALEPSADVSEELVLDDVLARLSPDSRVVRLFDPGQMPSAGELKTNIDRHLYRARSGTSPPDATQALSDALAQLRRSLH